LPEKAELTSIGGMAREDVDVRPPSWV
jgi:hypothetical protein